MVPLLLLRYDGYSNGWEDEFNQENRCDKINTYNYVQMLVRKSTDKD